MADLSIDQNLNNKTKRVEQMDLATQFLLAVSGICLVLAIALGLVGGKDDDDFGGMA